MTVQTYGLGGRIPLLEPGDLSSAQRKVYDLMSETMVPWANTSGFEAQTADGKMIGPFNAIMVSPGITTAFLKLQDAEQSHTTLTQRLRQVVILTVGAVWQSDYERYAHTAVALKAGIPDAAVRDLAAGVPARDLSQEEQLAQRFTQALTARHQIDDDLYTAAEAAFGVQGIVDITYLAGCYDTISSLLNTLRVPAPGKTE